MAHAITLTDGTTTVNLFSLTGTFPTTWSLGAPEEDRDTIGEAIDLLIQATSIANLQTAVRQIEALLDDAVRRERTKVGKRVYLTVQWDGEAQVWRSEVVSGRLEMHGAAEQYSRLKIEATLGITRRTFWEGPETGIPLTNGNGTWDGQSATGLNVYNCNDGAGTSPNKRNNYVQIAAADVTGALPAPVKIELKNVNASSILWNAFHLATNAFSAPSTWANILEAESRTAGGTVVANTDCSNGNDLQLTGYSSGQTVDWTISAALLQAAAGRWVRLLLSTVYRSFSQAQAETMQAQIMDSSGSFILYKGPEVSLSPSVAYRPFVDLGAFPFPPGGYDTAWGALKLRLTFRLASGTATTYLDYMQLTPMDSYRVLAMRPVSVAVNALIVDNGYDGLAYVETSGARAPYVLPRGEPLMVWPGRLQRVYVLADNVSSFPWPADFWSVRMWYRPRRLSI